MATDGEVYPCLSWPDGAVSGWKGTPWVRFPPRCGPSAKGRTSVARTDLISPVPTEEPAIAGRGWEVTATSVISWESMAMTMGERHGDGKASERREHLRAPEASEAPCRRQRGHVVSAWESPVQGEGPHRERRVRRHPAEGAPEGARAGASWPESAEHAGRQSSHGVAGCGERRTHGGNGGDGDTGREEWSP
jgi:hypothetical protein